MNTKEHKTSRDLYAELITKKYTGFVTCQEIPDTVPNTAIGIAEYCLSGTDLIQWKKDTMEETNDLRVKYGLDKDGLFDVDGKLIKD